MGDEGAVAGHRLGHRGRRRDVRHVPVELRLAPADARRLLRLRAICRRLRVAQARPVEPRAPHRRAARRRGRVHACGRRCHARRAGDGGAGHRSADLGARPRAPGAERRLPAQGTVGRCLASRRGARERGLLRRARLQARRPRRGDHQRTPPLAHDRRDRAVARIRLRDPSRRHLSGQAAVRDLLDEPARSRVGVQHGGRLQRRVDRDRARRQYGRRDRRARRVARALRRLRRDPAVRSDIRLDARQRAAAAPDLRLHHAGHLPRRRGLHPERRADARVVLAALSDRRAQGARVLESGAGLALHQMGARDRRIRRAGRRRGRRLARLGHDWPLQRVLPIPGPRLPSVDRRRRAVGDRQPRGRGGGCAVGRAARGPDSAGRSDAPGDAGPVSSQRRRARVAACPHDAGDADDSAQSRTSADPVGDVGDRHRLRRGRARSSAWRSSTS